MFFIYNLGILVTWIYTYAYAIDLFTTTIVNLFKTEITNYFSKHIVKGLWQCYMNIEDD